MNECVHHHKASCVRGPRTHSPGICARCEKYTPSDRERVPLTIKSTSKPQPIPRAEWPLLARVVARLKNDTDIGVGTTLERLIAHVGGEFYKTAFKSLTGRSCGCTDRRKHLDAIYSYNQA